MKEKKILFSVFSLISLVHLAAVDFTSAVCYNIRHLAGYEKILAVTNALCQRETATHSHKWLAVTNTLCQRETLLKITIRSHKKVLIENEWTQKLSHSITLSR